MTKDLSITYSQDLSSNRQQVILIERTYKILGPEDAPRQWDGPHTLPLVRWQPLAPVPEGTRPLERFNPAKGAKLSTYASLWIKQSIRRALSNQSKTIRLPDHVVDKVSHIRKAEVKLRELLGHIQNSRPLPELERLELELRRAVETQEFERAAELRDRLRELRQRKTAR